MSTEYLEKPRYKVSYNNEKTGEEILLTIQETSEEDLTDLQKLWADGDVMKFVGFPDGLIQTDDEMKRWYSRIESKRPIVNHFSVFLNGQYAGESYYSIDKEHDNLGTLDIKLFSFARGVGVAKHALTFAIEQAFANGASKVFVDPVKENNKAFSLYKKLGFVEKAFPSHLFGEGEPVSIYLEKSTES